MSKIIKLTDGDIGTIRDEITKYLEEAKMFDGKLNITKTFGDIERRAKLIFTEKAYIKMLSLVSNFNEEVAWHGLAKRGDDPEKDEYIIYDIIVYPQEVTGATVNTDQDKYQTWLMSHDDDVFNNIRMQGHSHVNMDVTPSAVDNSLYERILEQLDDSMFYIFLIFNKKNAKYIKIYDLMKNVCFYTQDIDIELSNEIGITEFVKSAKDLVKNKVYQTSYASSYTGGNVQYSSKPSSYCSQNSQTAESKINSKNKKKKKKSSSYPCSYYPYDDNEVDNYYNWGYQR